MFEKMKKQQHGLDVKRWLVFTSDWEAVMAEKKRDDAGLLREDIPSMANIHCVCHRLVLVWY